MDFDGDGNADILSGSWSPGELFLFRGQGKGQFSKGEVLKDKDGKSINVGNASTVFAYDWRGSGKLDLLCGCIEGFVWLVHNEGTRDKPAYGKPVKLQAGGKDIKVGNDSHPVVADWEGGGKPGLVVGCGNGSVLWFRNEGTAKEPKLAAAQTLVPAVKREFNPNKVPAGKDVGRGTRSKVCVNDFNGDGKLDLLVGDFAMGRGEKPKLSDEDKKLLKEAREKVKKVQKDLQPYLEEIRKIVTKADRTTDAGRAELNKKITALREKYKTQLEESHKVSEIIFKFEPPYQYHGHVWLFLRKEAAGTE